MAATIIGSSAGALAQDSSIEAAREALSAAWTAAPLHFTAATFVKAPATGYGIYDVREGNSFTDGETLHVYAEPVGYGYGKQDGLTTIDLSVDFALRNSTGQVLAEQSGFAKLHSAGHNRAHEYQSSLSFNLAGLQAGGYTLEVTFNDQNSTKNGSFSLPLEISE
ncbi:hypothetical protein [Polycladidibacter hongkongensis]|uniref:hypothetical protein n=1 Tax=Polycladidibacter hongkongensis TaxID=1647556 RepID=UPI000AB4D90D|nr:hypothetical protein [Pseudovibrio hongkongensis]